MSEGLDAAKSLFEKSSSKGVALNKVLSTPMELTPFLEIAISIANLVGAAQSRGKFFGDLTPKDFILQSQNINSHAVDLQIRPDSETTPEVKRRFHLREEAYPYISPEQTGRVSRVIDYRTDYYSLGIIFYEMLTGALPFQAKDFPGWVHCHVAQVPAFPSTSKVPLPVRSIVLKLLSKEPDDRYQTPLGLIFDLNACLSQMKEKGSIEPFVLGQHDRSKIFRLPQRFYGHAKELQALEQTFQRVVDSGNSEFIMISGEPGVGKTRLVSELSGRVARDGGFFASAKPDQYKANMPYSTLASAFAALVSEILTRNDEEIRQWAQVFQSALGMNAQLIIDLVPQFSLIYSPSIPLPKLLPVEAEARFIKAGKEFLSVFVQRSRCVVLFFDDLQWADSDSLKWLDHFFSNPEVSSILIIGTYRSTEAAGNPALIQFLKNVNSSQGLFTAIQLESLTQADFDHLINDTFHGTNNEINSVSNLIYKKTAGNPFFARQFLSNLAQEQFITFSNESGWVCDHHQIQEREFTDNIVDFMAARLKVQSQVTQSILKAAAAIGTVTDVSTLGAMTGLDSSVIHQALSTAVEIGLLFKDGESYRFLHDRIQESAYSFIPEQQRSDYHLRIGRFFLDHTSESELSSRVFEILSHFQKALPLMKDEKEAIRIAEVNLFAARKAKTAAAYSSAMNYILMGLRLCEMNPESPHYDLEFSLRLEQAECEYLLGEYENSEAHCKSLLLFARNRNDQAQVFLIEVSLFEIQGQFDRGINSLIQCLRLYDIEISAHPTMEQVLAICEEIWKELGDRKIEDLVHLPVIQDPELLTVLRALSHNICSYFTDEKLFLFQGATIVQVSLKHGNSASAVSGYGMVALFLGPLFGKYREAYEFGKLACKLVEVHGFESARAMALDEFAAFVNYWINPLSTSIPYLRQANEAALKLGQMNWFCYSSYDILTTRLLKGDLLPDVLRERDELKRRIQSLGNSPISLLIQFLSGFIFQMSGLTTSFSSMSNGDFNQEQFEKHELERYPPLIQCWYYTFVLKSCVFVGEFLKGEHIAERIEKILWSTAGQYTYPEFHFLTALTLTHLYRTSSSDKQSQYMKRLLAIQDQMRTWASNCEQNFSHKFALISAEIARVQGMSQKAMRYYEDAILSAHHHGFLQIEALAYELAGKFYSEEGYASFSASYLTQARTCYQEWGAYGKVRQLEDFFPALFNHGNESKSSNEFHVRSEDIDLISAVKSSQAISSITEPEKLIHNLLQVILEQSGGQRVVLFLKGNEKKLEIAAEATAFQMDFQLRKRGAAQEPESSRVPQSIINYSSQTRENVLLNEVGARGLIGPFSNDPYFLHSKPKSLLCMPVLSQQEVIGLIYLENDVTSYAFSKERLTVLQLLAAQAAISLQNADLYQGLRNAIELRDDFLALASHELRTPIVPLKLHLDILSRQLQKLPQDIFRTIEPVSEAIQKTKRRLDDMQKLIESLFDVSLIKGGQLTLRKETVSLIGLVRNVIQVLESELGKAGCILDLQAPAEIIGNWDPLRLEQVVVNLLTNAIKFGPGKSIRVRVEHAGDHAIVSVADEGIGIKKEDQLRIFQKFERASSSMKYSGLGLGLHITHEIVVAHGGEITVQSEPGKGSIFTAILPLRP